MRRPPLWISAASVMIILTGVVLVFVLGPRHRLGPITISESSPSPAPPPIKLLPAGRLAAIPVLLVHGYAGAPSQMRPLADRLTREGRHVVLVTLPERGTVDIRLSALAVVLAARQLHAPKVDIIGYSLGGVAARQALLFHDGSIHVRHLVMMATPNHGALLPDDSGRPQQEHCEPNNACGELAPNSPLLEDLNKSPYAKGSRDWLTIASATDRLVRPPATVALAGAKNLLLQDVCPGATEDHGQMDDSPSVMGLVLLFLNDQLPANPVCSEALGVGQG